jgi:transaldolase/glucose-6-phosphate isomerase
MIKVPGTPAGMPAVRTLIGEGVNVNVTLLFAVDTYLAAARAYIDGLDDYVRAGGKQPDRVASVASFFVSRVDTAADGRLQELIDEGDAPEAVALLGKAGIANAKLAYAEFQGLFEGEAFAGLALAGARPQRPLWGSTGVKNTAYPDTLYLDELMGPHTVNTAPPATIDAFIDHGTPGETVTRGVDEARRQITRLGELGIDLDGITDDLLAAGVESFSDSFKSLLRRVDEKRRELSGR